MYGRGSSFYLDGRYLSMTIQGNTQITNSKSNNGHGGFAYINNANVITITGTSSSGTSTFIKDVQANYPYSGSMIYSIATAAQFVLTQALFDCKTVAFTASSV